MRKRSRRISELKNRAIFADIISTPFRVNATHKKGVNAGYANGSVVWIRREVFTEPLDAIPTETFNNIYNTSMEQIREAFDREAGITEPYDWTRYE